MLCSARGWRCDPSGLLTHGKPPPSTFNYARDIAGLFCQYPNTSAAGFLEASPRLSRSGRLLSGGFRYEVRRRVQ